MTGDINAPHVIINGTVNGDVYASAHLELAEKASINGSVYYNLIEMAMGASVNGNLVHQREPVGLLSQDAKAAGSVQKQASAGDQTPESEVSEDGGKSE